MKAYNNACITRGGNCLSKMLYSAKIQYNIDGYEVSPLGYSNYLILSRKMLEQRIKQLRKKVGWSQ